MKKLFAAGIAALAFIGCASAPPAPKAADGGKIPVQVFIDAGWEQVDTTNPNQTNQRRQLANFMETDLLKLLNKAGYEASAIKSADAYGSDPKARFLSLKIENYNPGSAAARVLVGLGAGSATLDVRSVYREGGKTLMDIQKSFASGRDWRKIVRKINIHVIREMNQHPG